MLWGFESNRVIFKIVIFEARVWTFFNKCSRDKYGTICKNRHTFISGHLGVRVGGNSVMESIFETVNFNARVTELLTSILGINIRLLCLIGRIVLPGESVWSKLYMVHLFLKTGYLKLSSVDAGSQL